MNPQPDPLGPTAHFHNGRPAEQLNSDALQRLFQVEEQVPDALRRPVGMAGYVQQSERKAVRLSSGDTALGALVQWISSLHRGRGNHPAQHDSCVTSLLKVCAASFRPSTMVR